MGNKSRTRVTNVKTGKPMKWAAARNVAASHASSTRAHGWAGLMERSIGGHLKKRVERGRQEPMEGMKTVFWPSALRGTLVVAR